jgi:hypothetical protein
LAVAGIHSDRWLQLWSRQPKSSTSWVAPFGLLMRLYAKEGDYRAAYESGEADMREQGYYAQGSRLVLGLIARPANSEKLSLKYVNEVTEGHNPPGSWDHMRAERDLILADLTNSRFPDREPFLGQAMSPKGPYYSWAGLADLKYFLAAEVSRPLRYEYGRNLLVAYQLAGRGDQYSVRQIAEIVKNRA